VVGVLVVVVVLLVIVATMRQFALPLSACTLVIRGGSAQLHLRKRNRLLA
jgi:hypothetical protein